MTNSIGNISNRIGGGLPITTDNKPAGATDGDSGFSELLKSTLRQAGGLQIQAEHSIQEHLIGGEITQAEAFTDLRKADLAMRMLLQIRNKLLESFNEIKQMQF